MTATTPAGPREHTPAAGRPGALCPAGYISPLIVSCLGDAWAAVCISPLCGLPHDVLGGDGTRRAAETAADTHLKTLLAKES